MMIDHELKFFQSVAESFERTFCMTQTFHRELEALRAHNVLYNKLYNDGEMCPEGQLIK